ncbi:hypothetical protein FOA52_015117 [Chlamydomonas sp. UWO 241]|nr:hypothetical protein FOA52_015117 [Chlamydomonas sp. UWO 241]
MQHGAKGLKDLEAQERAAAASHEKAAARQSRVDPHEELVEQVVEEIRERREFLEAMQAAGRGAEYVGVKGEIAQRLKDLERLGVDVASSRPARPKQDRLLQ